MSSFAELPEHAELFYRELPSGNEKARFVARVIRNERKITTTTVGRIEFSAEQASIEQKLRLQVDYEPLDALDLAWTTPPRSGIYNIVWRPMAIMGIAG